MHGSYFHVAMLAYDLNCWLMLFNPEEEVQKVTLKHTIPAVASPTQDKELAAAHPERRIDRTDYTMAYHHRPEINPVGSGIMGVMRPELRALYSGGW
jgi:hypothetical protein